MGVHVESPFPSYAVPRLYSWIEAFGPWRVRDDFGPQTLKALLDSWPTYESEPFKTWGVWRDGDLGGLITVRSITPHLAEAHAIFRKSFFGHETTIPALRAVFDQVFQSGVSRIESNIFYDNDSMLALARKLGAQKEGTLRQRTIRNGRPVDMIIVGLLAVDFYKRQEKETCLKWPSSAPRPDSAPSPERSTTEAAPLPAPAEPVAS